MLSFMMKVQTLKFFAFHYIIVRNIVNSQQISLLFKIEGNLIKLNQVPQLTIVVDFYVLTSKKVNIS